MAASINLGVSVKRKWWLKLAIIGWFIGRKLGVFKQSQAEAYGLWLARHALVFKVHGDKVKLFACGKHYLDGIGIALH